MIVYMLFFICMDDNKFLEMYRVQAINKDSKPLVNKNIPIKKVIISNAGKISFNPDSNQYVYFSRYSVPIYILVIPPAQLHAEQSLEYDLLPIPNNLCRA